MGLVNFSQKLNDPQNLKHFNAQDIKAGEWFLVKKYRMTIFDTSFHFRTKRKFIIKCTPFLIQKPIKPTIQLFDRIIEMVKEKSQCAI